MPKVNREKRLAARQMGVFLPARQWCRPLMPAAELVCGIVVLLFLFTLAYPARALPVAGRAWALHRRGNYHIAIAILLFLNLAYPAGALPVASRAWALYRRGNYHIAIAILFFLNLACPARALPVAGRAWALHDRKFII